MDLAEGNDFNQVNNGLEDGVVGLLVRLIGLVGLLGLICFK